MRNRPDPTIQTLEPPVGRDTVSDLLAQLRTDGIILLPNLLPPDRLNAMQRAFEVKLRRLRWNNFDGYQ